MGAVEYTVGLRTLHWNYVEELEKLQGQLAGFCLTKERRLMRLITNNKLPWRS